MGTTLLWLSLIVLIPLAALFLKTTELTLERFVRIITSPRVLHALELSFGLSFLAAAVNLVFGFAVVDKVVDKKGTRGAAEDYLKFLYTPVGQEIAARGFYRTRDGAVAQTFGGNFPKVELFAVDEAFGGWRKAQSEHFNDGGVFDTIYTQ